MTDHSALLALLTRVEAATGPDREIDGDIAKSLAGWSCVKMKGDAKPYWRSPEQQREYYLRSIDGPPLYTSSLDAAVALVEKVRPKWDIFCGHNWAHFHSTDPERRAYFCNMGPRFMPDGSLNEETTFNVVGHGRTEALARLAALLRSMIEEEGK